jgi:hypothetical protein
MPRAAGAILNEQPGSTHHAYQHKPPLDMEQGMTSISVLFQSFAERLHLVFLRVHRLARLSPEHKTLVKIVRSSALPMSSLAITDPFTIATGHKGAC